MFRSFPRRGFLGTSPRHIKTAGQCMQLDRESDFPTRNQPPRGATNDDREESSLRRVEEPADRPVVRDERTRSPGR
jgi:hypothetical protein